MLMIISLHYFDKGGILHDPKGDLDSFGLMVWLLEAFCSMSVNAYVLISGYFMIERDYDAGRCLKLWEKVIFYSLSIAVLYSLVIRARGGCPAMDKYTLLHFILPLSHEHYWFVTAYCIMILMAPLMNKGLRDMDRAMYRKGLIALVTLLSVTCTLLPVKLPIDRLGYDALWFIVLYLLGAYLRLHGLGFSRRLAGAGYIVSGLVIFGSLLAVRALYLKTGALGDFISRQYHYNTLVNLLGAVCLLVFFSQLNIKEGRAADIIRRLAGSSLGVYLIHEHELVRYEWPRWLGVAAMDGSPLMVLHWIGSVLLVYAVCGHIDYLLRKYILK